MEEVKWMEAHGDRNVAAREAAKEEMKAQYKLNKRTKLDPDQAVTALDGGGRGACTEIGKNDKPRGQHTDPTK